jgi:glutathionyl-hydroquinone reductase
VRPFLGVFTLIRLSGGRYTVPILWDKTTGTIVNNESIEIIKILNSSFNHLLPEGSAGRELDLFPSALAATIEEANSWIYPQINNGLNSFLLFFLSSSSSF